MQVESLVQAVSLQHVEIVNYVSSNGTKALAVVEVDEYKGEQHMNGYNSGRYSTLVTLFPPDGKDRVIALLKNKNNIVFDVEKKKGNQAFDKAMGEIEGYLNSHTKADTVYYAEQHGVKLGAKDKKLGAEDKLRLKKMREDGVSFALPKSNQEGYDTTNLHWAISSGILSEADQARF